MSRSDAFLALVLMAALGTLVVDAQMEKIEAARIANADTIQDPIPVMIRDARSAYVLVTTKGPLPAGSFEDNNVSDMRHQVRMASIPLEGNATDKFEESIRTHLIDRGFKVKAVHWFWESITVKMYKEQTGE